MDTQKTPEQQDVEIINKVIPTWVQKLNWLYDHTFAPLDRFLEHLRAAPTRQFIADFEAREARRTN